MVEIIMSIYMENPYAQFVGIIATIVMTYSGTIKDDKKMLYWFTASLIIWSAHFFLLALPMAGLLYFYMFVRNLFFFKWPKNKWLFIIAAIVPFVILYFEYESHVDVVASIAPLIFIYGVYFLKGIKLRISFILISFIWIYYSWHAQSIGGIATEVLYLGGIAIGVYKFLKGRKES